MVEHSSSNPKVPGSIPGLERIPERIDDIEHNYNYTGGS